EKLLEEGDYTRERKNEINSNRLLARIYWCSVTFLFLGISFLTFEWWISWIIWPLAGVLYGIICGIAAVVRKRKIAG
ncbi:MAG: XRE family transcriptional regulator, partial [Firmicutes bacterium]|nr:XRE family transcriptional regulator [Bacillota bacterium]